MGTNHRYTATEYKKAMRDMIWRVQDGYEPPFYSSHEELEIFAECIRRGYLSGTTTTTDKTGHERELRTLDGKIHPILFSHSVTLAGLEFLSESKDHDREKPNKTNNSKRQERTSKKFYQSGEFWAAIAVFVTVLLWIADRFILSA